MPSLSSNRKAGPAVLFVNGIPSFKLEKAVVERRFDLLAAARSRDPVRRHRRARYSVVDFARRIRRGFSGNWRAESRKQLDIPGADLRGVFHALPFLIQKNLPEPSGDCTNRIEGKRVAVFGGGDTAMDCLRTAIRCGAREAICIYRRDLENMPGSRREYGNAIEEGARFMFLTNAVSLSGNATDEAYEARCVRMELGEPDAKGRRKPRPIPGSEFTRAGRCRADRVRIRSGTDFRRRQFGQNRVNKWGGVIVDENQMTSVPGMFAGGDLVRGPDLVVRAVRDSRKAAAGIHKYLSSKRCCERLKQMLEPAVPSE